MKNDAENQESRYQKALRLREEGDFTSAIRILADLMQEDLLDVRGATSLASMLAESGQVDRAGHVFEHALKLAPSDIYLRSNYGAFLGQTGRLEQAKDLLQRLVWDLERDVTNADDRPVGGPVAHDVDDLRHGHGIALANLGRTYLAMNKPQVAMAILEKHLTCPWSWESIHSVYAECVDALSETDPAAHAARLVERRLASPLMVFYLVEAALDDGDLHKAVDWLARGHEYLGQEMLACCLEEDPDLAARMAELRSLLVRQQMRGQTETGDREQFDRALGRSPDGRSLRSEVAVEHWRIVRELEERITKRGSPVSAPMHFEELLIHQERVLACFELPPSQEYLDLLRPLDPRADAAEEFAKLSAALSRRSKELAATRRTTSPLEMLIRGKKRGDSAGTVLPKIGIPVHMYTLFLWDCLSLVDPWQQMRDEGEDAPASLLSEMQAAVPLLDQLGRIKEAAGGAAGFEVPAVGASLAHLPAFLRGEVPAQRRRDARFRIRSLGTGAGDGDENWYDHCLERREGEGWFSVLEFVLVSFRNREQRVRGIFRKPGEDALIFSIDRARDRDAGPEQYISTDDGKTWSPVSKENERDLSESQRQVIS